VVGYRNVGRDITDSKRAEEALRESEEKYRDLVENISDAIYELDADGRVTYMSPIVEEVSGYSPSEIVGRPFTEFVHPEDVPALVERFRKALSGEPEPIEYRLPLKSGEIRWYHSFGQPIFEGERIVGFRGVQTDITERKRAEEALRESEGRYRGLIEASPDAIALSDLMTNIIMVNEQNAKILGFDGPEDMIGLRSFDFIAPEDQERAVKNTRKTLETGTVRNAEYTLLRKDGTRFPAELSASVIVDTAGNPVAFTAVTRDITERKVAEEALKRTAAPRRSSREERPPISVRGEEDDRDPGAPDSGVRARRAGGEALV
jgi:PAS domain S-box-containing protein